MNVCEPFQPQDLVELDRLLSRADRVVAMEQIAAGDTNRHTIGLRHDVDNVILPAVDFAHWEADRGYRSTYFILHTAPYWSEKHLLRSCCEEIIGLGHEIGFHVNALTEALVTGRDPVEIAAEAVDELRGYGFPVHGVVAHGDPMCYRANYVNDELFLESPRPSYGKRDRVLEANGRKVRIRPVSRLQLGLDYDPNWLPRAQYLSDSGGRWSQPFQQVADGYPTLNGQLHMLVHPDWWAEAFEMAAVA